MESKRAVLVSDGAFVNEWKIYRDITGELHRGCVIGMGIGVKPKDVYSFSSKHGCSKS